MPCFRPLKGYLQTYGDAGEGKRKLVFSPKDGFTDRPITVPCGQCLGCRLERSRQWAIRCVHEASLYDRNCFLTLTFDDANLPADGSLDVKTFQDFMKRLRKRYGAGIRFYHCGEYGEKFGRPHYHACIFNFDFPDKYQWRKTDRGDQVWRSDALDELWPFGFAEIGAVTFESAAYVARYITKKIVGDKKFDHYGKKWVVEKDEEGNEWVVPKCIRQPEYATMSRRPGIGKAWFDLYTKDVYPFDEVVIRGKEMRPPKFYDRCFEVAFPADFAKLKRNRAQTGKWLSEMNPESTLAVREEAQFLRFKLLKRGYDNG